MTAPGPVIVGDLLSAEVRLSQPAIYDTPIGLRELFTDPDTGAEHYLVHYPAGARAAPHHHTAAQTIVVLDGALRVDDQTLGPGSYCHQPAMTTMQHEPAPGQHCRFVTIFQGPFDVFSDIDSPGA